MKMSEKVWFWNRHLYRHRWSYALLPPQLFHCENTAHICCVWCVSGMEIISRGRFLGRREKSLIGSEINTDWTRPGGKATGRLRHGCTMFKTEALKLWLCRVQHRTTEYGAFKTEELSMAIPRSKQKHWVTSFLRWGKHCPIEEHACLTQLNTPTHPPPPSAWMLGLQIWATLLGGSTDLEDRQCKSVTLIWESWDIGAWGRWKTEWE